MKCVWIFNHYAQEPGGAGGTRHFGLAKHLRAYGWDAVVIASSVELNTGRQRLSDGVAFERVEYEGVPFVWVRTPEYAGNGGGRLLNMLKYAFGILDRNILRTLPLPDAIVGSSVHPFAVVAAAFLARRYKVPLIFEVRDLWPQTLIDMGRLKRGSGLAVVMRFLERWLYREAKKIVVLLPRAHEYIVPLGVAADKIVCIPNGVEISDRDFPVWRPVGEIFELMYLGAHGQANGLECLIEAMAILNRDWPELKVRLKLVGDGPEKPKLISLVHSKGLNNVFFQGSVPKREVPKVAGTADAFVICVRDLPGLYRYGISMNKLFDYMASARPTIIAVEAANNPIADAHAGISVRPDDPRALASAIKDLAEMDASEREKMGRAGWEYVNRNHSYRSLAERFSKVLDSAISCR